MGIILYKSLVKEEVGLKALITFKYKDEEMKLLEDLGYEIIFNDERQFSFSDDMRDVDLLVCFDPFEKLD